MRVVFKMEMSEVETGKMMVRGSGMEYSCLSKQSSCKLLTCQIRLGLSQ